MRSNKMLSIIVAILVMGANFVTICHADAGKNMGLHFIAQSCESHECTHNTESQSCSKDHCDHEICTDQSVLGEYIAKSPVHFETVVPPIPAIIIEDLFLPKKQSDLLISIIYSPPDPVQHSTAILRI